MNWTTEYPTQPGFYWLRNYIINCYPEKPEWNEMESVPTVVEVGGDEFFWTGSEISTGRAELLSGEWFGPILPSDESRLFTIAPWPPAERDYEYKEETLSGSNLAALVPVMPHRWHIEPHYNCWCLQPQENDK